MCQRDNNPAKSSKQMKATNGFQQSERRNPLPEAGFDWVLKPLYQFSENGSHTIL